MDLWYGLQPNQSPVSVPFIIHTRLLACIIPKQLKRAPRIAAGRRGRIKIGWGERSERSMSEEQFLDVAVEAAKNAGEVPPPHRRGFFALRFLVLGPSVHRFLISWPDHPQGILPDQECGAQGPGIIYSCSYDLVPHVVDVDVDAPIGLGFGLTVLRIARRCRWIWWRRRTRPARTSSSTTSGSTFRTTSSSGRRRPRRSAPPPTSQTNLPGSSIPSMAPPISSMGKVAILYLCVVGFFTAHSFSSSHIKFVCIFWTCSFPFVCVSIGLTIGKIPTVGVVYNPIMNEVSHDLTQCSYL